MKGPPLYLKDRRDTTELTPTRIYVTLDLFVFVLSSCTPCGNACETPLSSTIYAMQFRDDGFLTWCKYVSQQTRPSVALFVEMAGTFAFFSIAECNEGKSTPKNGENFKFIDIPPTPPQIYTCPKLRTRCVEQLPVKA